MGPTVVVTLPLVWSTGFCAVLQYCWWGQECPLCNLWHKPQWCKPYQGDMHVRDEMGYNDSTESTECHMSGMQAEVNLDNYQMIRAYFHCLVLSVL